VAHGWGTLPAVAVAADVQRIALALPETSERLYYGTPGFFHGKTFFARLWEDMETLVVRMPFDERERRLAGEPGVFFLTDHYLKYPLVLARLGEVDEARLGELLFEAWRLADPPPARTRKKAVQRG
jgi:hypothetical protein